MPNAIIHRIIVFRMCFRFLAHDLVSESPNPHGTVIQMPRASVTVPIIKWMTPKTITKRGSSGNHIIDGPMWASRATAFIITARSIMLPCRV